MHNDGAASTVEHARLEVAEKPPTIDRPAGVRRHDDRLRSVELHAGGHGRPPGLAELSGEAERRTGLEPNHRADLSFDRDGRQERRHSGDERRATGGERCASRRAGVGREEQRRPNRDDTTGDGHCDGALEIGRQNAHARQRLVAIRPIPQLECTCERGAQEHDYRSGNQGARNRRPPTGGFGE